MPAVVEKPHRGTIVGSKLEVPVPPSITEKNLGYIIVGRFKGHVYFDGSLGHTSLIVKKSKWVKNSCEVETLNSRYTWERP